mmetsp:Transcript_17264/g.41154  ORF Transcript_17264/g.41154 Transcript_17264/m.41154 type:complete len:208 (-) Transcript_17264:162-785(-)
MKLSPMSSPAALSRSHRMCCCCFLALILFSGARQFRSSSRFWGVMLGSCCINAMGSADTLLSWRRISRIKGRTVVCRLNLMPAVIAELSMWVPTTEWYRLSSAMRGMARSAAPTAEWHADVSGQVSECASMANKVTPMRSSASTSEARASGCPPLWCCRVASPHASIEAAGAPKRGEGGGTGGVGSCALVSFSRGGKRERTRSMVSR